MNRQEEADMAKLVNIWVKRSLGTLAVLVVAGMAGCPHYTVWQQGLAGKAALERAMQDRQIKVQEAQAKFDASDLLAKSDVRRAEGVAKANEIIGNSLKNNEAYLRYLWISNLETGGNQVIYVPTEAGLPILEAGKRPAQEKK